MGRDVFSVVLILMECIALEILAGKRDQQENEILIKATYFGPAYQ